MTENGKAKQAPELIREGNLVGLKTSEGEVILPAEYQDIKILSLKTYENGERVVVQKNDKWGIVIADGNSLPRGFI